MSLNNVIYTEPDAKEPFVIQTPGVSPITGRQVNLLPQIEFVIQRTS